VPLPVLGEAQVIGELAAALKSFCETSSGQPKARVIGAWLFQLLSRERIGIMTAPVVVTVLLLFLCSIQTLDPALGSLPRSIRGLGDIWSNIPGL
jgi:hypothetical protein